VCVSSAYNWHYVLRASPNSRTPCAPDPGAKTAKKQSKGIQAPHWPTRCKKARPRQAPVKFLIDFISEVKILPGALLFILACISRELSFFPVFSLWKWF
jgi:hypothetical protein